MHFTNVMIDVPARRNAIGDILSYSTHAAPSGIQLHQLHLDTSLGYTQSRSPDLQDHSQPLHLLSEFEGLEAPILSAIWSFLFLCLFLSCPVNLAVYIQQDHNDGKSMCLSQVWDSWLQHPVTNGMKPDAFRRFS